MSLLVKLLIVLVLIFIIISLGSGLFFMLKDNTGKRTAKALTYRIGFSALLISILLIALATGVIKPNQTPIGIFEPAPASNGDGAPK